MVQKMAKEPHGGTRANSSGAAEAGRNGQRVWLTADEEPSF